MSNKCKFVISWVGNCNKETVNNEDFCEEHKKYKCTICGEQATHECPETIFGSMVCGAYLCDKKEYNEKHYKERHCIY